MVKRSRVRFEKRFNFGLTAAMQADLYKIAEQADNADVADVVRRMITLQTPFFLSYTSKHGMLPNGELLAKAEGR